MYRGSLTSALQHKAAECLRANDNMLQESKADGSQQRQDLLCGCALDAAQTA